MGVLQITLTCKYINIDHTVLQITVLQITVLLYTVLQITVLQYTILQITMRITEQVLPLAFLFLSLPLSLVFEFTLVKVVLMMASVCVLRLALVQYMLINKSKDKRMILETISISHYVEKVRWCLDYLDLDYVEEEDVGILGVF